MSAEDTEIRAERQAIEFWTREALRILGPCPADLKETTIQVPLSDGSSQKIIMIWPANVSEPKKKLPLIVLFHGGGWATGSPEFMLCPARAYASLIGAVVACPSYKYAPENPFPAPMHSAWDVTAWLSHAENINGSVLLNENVEADPSLGLVLGGVSAGGHLAAVLAGISAAVATESKSVLAEGLSSLAHPITGVFTAVPLLLHESIVPSKYASLWTSPKENADAPILNADALAFTLERIKADFRSPWYSPFNLDLAGIKSKHAPRVYIQAGQLDILRDDAVIYERALRDEGIADTRIDVIENIDHVAWCTLPVPTCHSDEIRTKSLDGMAWLLGKDWNKDQKLPY